jgi:flagellar capping protein FliD
VTTVGSKLTALRDAAESLRTASGVLAHAATSSAEGVLTAAAGAGAAKGSLSMTVTQLARASTALGAVGVGSATATVATGTGQLQFQVGGGDVQTVDVDGATTLEGLAAAINELDAGVVASAINLGTEAVPDWRLHLVGQDTGSASTITVVRDDTQLSVQTTLTGQDAQFTVSGIATTFSRQQHVLRRAQRRTVSLKSLGTATVTVDEDPDTIVDRVRGLVTAFNDLTSFVRARRSRRAGRARMWWSEPRDRLLRAGARQPPRRDRLGAHRGAATQFVNLARPRHLDAAGRHAGAGRDDARNARRGLRRQSRRVLAGVARNGIADELTTWIDQATSTGGVLDTHETSLDDRMRSLQDQIAVGERRLWRVGSSSRTRFAALEGCRGPAVSEQLSTLSLRSK